MSSRPFQDDQHEPLFQIWVTERHPVFGKRDMPVGPRMCRRFLEPLMMKINMDIAGGKEKTSEKPWSNPRLVEVVKLRHESPFTREDRANDRVGGHRFASGLVH